MVAPAAVVAEKVTVSWYLHSMSSYASTAGVNPGSSAPRLGLSDCSVASLLRPTATHSSDDRAMTKRNSETTGARGTGTGVAWCRLSAQTATAAAVIELRARVLLAC